MGQFFALRSRKFVNWTSPVFLKNIFFYLFDLYTSNKCFFIIIRSTFPVHVDPMRLTMAQNLSPISHHAKNHARKLTIFLLLPRPFLLSPSPFSHGYYMDSLQTSARLFIQDGGVSLLFFWLYCVTTVTPFIERSERSNSGYAIKPKKQ